MGLFAHYEADPGSVRAIASHLLDGSTKVSNLRVSVDNRHDLSVAATGGILTAPLAGAVIPFDTHAGTTAQCATIAGGALNLFAKDIDTFNAGIDDLNARWATALATGFSVDADGFYERGGPLTLQQRDARYHAALASAQSALRASLTHEEQILRSTLDTGADLVVAILDKGPSNEAALALAMNGELPAQASVTFPGVLADFKTIFDPAAGAYTLADLAHAGVETFKSQYALEAATLALVQGRNLADADTRAVLRLVGGDATDMRVLTKYYSGEQSLNPLKVALTAAETARDDTGLVQAASATSRLAKGVAVLGIGSGIYDIGWNPSGATGVERGIEVFGDGASITAGTGTLLLAAGVLTGAAATVLAPIVIGAAAVAGAIALGTLVYDHWDDITDAASTAYDWTKDKVGDAVDAIGDTVDNAAGWLDDEAKKIPLIGGLF